MRSINAIRFNAALYAAQRRKQRDDYRNERLWLIDSRFQCACVTIRKSPKICTRPANYRKTLHFLYQLIPPLGFSVCCVTRCCDKLTRMKKLGSRIVNRNVFYELFQKWWANSSLTNAFKTFVILLKD